MIRRGSSREGFFSLFIRSPDQMFWSDILDPVSAWSLLLGGAEDFHYSSVCPQVGTMWSQMLSLTQSGDKGRMESPPRGLSLPSQEMAGDDRSMCVLCESPLWYLFCWYGCHASVTGFSSGVRLSSVRLDSSASGEAVILARHNYHSDCTLFGHRRSGIQVFLIS